MDKETSRKAITELVEKYKKVLDEGNVGKYNEEMTKKDFILPLFRCLGWDIENSNEVTAEENISKKRVDYSFRINGIPKFFLEAKSLREQLDKDNYKFYKQAVEYSWYKGCTWAVLTDFEHMRILNAEVKSTNPLQSQFRWIDYNEYFSRFEELWLLSRESFEQGLLDKEADRLLKRTKKQKVDEQLLSDFTVFRETLSKNVTKLNQSRHLSEDELDEAIQRILDRLIFIRNCEDRELEEKRLWEAKNEIHAWKKVKEIFAYYDKNYDSKLFTYDATNPKSVHLCDTLDIDDDVIRIILNGLYRTRDDFVSYDFSAIDADVLGTVYEQYLGHILKKTEKRASLTENHVHKKEQGIYYTPTYIVDYIVRNALGELLKEKKTGLENIRVLDPACGSGSFLIKAFDVLNEYYERNITNYSQTQLDLKTGIPFTTKVRILQNNIFGVDLDKQAVEIAQLNLLLKITEKGHRLPLLEENILCGNSLIDDEKVAGDEAFKWDKQFAEIMRDGGFDVVIGNPPYVRQEELGEFKPYFEAKYDSYKGTADLLVYFFEKGLSLLQEGGYFGFIASNKFMRSDYGVNLRTYILKHCSIEKIIDFGELPVFKDASTFPCIFILRNGKPLKNHKFLFCSVKTLDFRELSDYVAKHGLEVEQSSLGSDTWVITDEKAQGITVKMNNQGVVLKEYAQQPLRGILTGFNEAFVIDEETKNELIRADPKNAEIIHPTIRGKDIIPYGNKDPKLWLIVSKDGIDIPKEYPEIYKHLSKYREALEAREDQGKFWYNLRPCKYYEEFEKPKIIYGDISLRNRFTIDTKNYYPLKTCFIIPNADKYLLALLNSKLFEFYMRQRFPTLGDPEMGGRILHGATYMNKLPIKIIDQVEQQSILRLVGKMLSLNERINDLADKKTDERERIEDDVRKTDTEINNLVYEIYGLTDAEKKIIEVSLR